MSRIKIQRKTPHNNCYRGNTIVQGCFRSPPPCAQRRNAVSRPRRKPQPPRRSLLRARLYTKTQNRSTVRKDAEFQDTLHTCTMARACKADGKYETPPARLSRNANARRGPKTDLQAR